jgi:hypothetical protein
MAILTNSAEGGTNSTVVTVGNSGGVSGDPFSWVQSTVQYTTAQAAHGGVAFRWVGAASTDAGSVAYGISGATMAVSTYFRLSDTTQPGSLLYRLGVSGVSDGAAQVFWSGGAGNLNLRSRSVTHWTSPSPLPENQWIRVELYATAGSSTTTGSLRLAYYLGDSTTPTGDSGLITGINVAEAVGAFNEITVGKSSLQAYVGDFYWDSIQVRTGADATGLIGPWPVPPLNTPVVTITGTTNPSTIANTDGSITVTWPAVSGADHYEAGIANVLGETDDFVEDSDDATSPHTFTGLSSGDYTVAIRAMPVA